MWKGCDITRAQRVTQRNVTQAVACLLSNSPVCNSAVCSTLDKTIIKTTKCVFVIKCQRMVLCSCMMKYPHKYSRAAHLPTESGLLIWHSAAECEEGSCSLLTDADIGVPLWHCAFGSLIVIKNKTSDEKFWQHELKMYCVPLRFTSGARSWRTHCKALRLTLCGPQGTENV